MHTALYTMSDSSRPLENVRWYIQWLVSQLNSHKNLNQKSSVLFFPHSTFPFLIVSSSS